MIQRWAAIPVGYAMEYYGRKKGHVAVEWLGHYLSCRGTKKVITPELARTIHDQIGYGWGRCGKEGGSFWTTMYCTTKTIQKPIKGDIGKSDSLYYALGKCLIRKSFTVDTAEDFEVYSMWHLMDYYTFYPTCRAQAPHGRTCNCPDKHKTYKAITLIETDYPNWLYKVSIKIAEKIRSKLYNFYKKHDYDWEYKPRLHEVLQRVLKVRKFFGDEGKLGIPDKSVMAGYIISITPPWRGELEIDVSDKIFTWFGKPFYTVCHAEVK
jgi:hypothetical protein